MTIETNDIIEAIKSNFIRLFKRLVVSTLIAVLGFLLVNYVFQGFLITEVLPWNLLECQWKGWLCVGFITTIIFDMANSYWLDLIPSGILIFEIILISIFMGVLVLV